MSEIRDLLEATRQRQPLAVCLSDYAAARLMAAGLRRRRSVRVSGLSGALIAVSGSHSLRANDEHMLHQFTIRLFCFMSVYACDQQADRVSRRLGETVTMSRRYTFFEQIRTVRIRIRIRIRSVCLHSTRDGNTCRLIYSAPISQQDEKRDENPLSGASAFVPVIAMRPSVCPSVRRYRIAR